MPNHYDRKKIHKGHRKRIIESFTAKSSYMHDHQILEIFLMNVIPRIDVNPIAHALIDQFKSIENVMRASDEELLSVEGIGPKTLKAFRATGELLKHFLAESDNDVLKIGNNDFSNCLYAQCSQIVDSPLFICFFDNVLALKHIETINENVEQDNLGIKLCQALNMRASISVIVYNIKDMSFLKEKAEHIISCYNQLFKDIGLYTFNIMDFVLLTETSKTDEGIDMEIYKPFYSHIKPKTKEQLLDALNFNTPDTVHIPINILDELRLILQ